MKTRLSLNSDRRQCCDIRKTGNFFVSNFKPLSQLFRFSTALLALSCIESPAAEKHSTWAQDASGLWTESYHWSTPSYPVNSGTNLYSATIDMPSRTVTLDTDITLENFDLTRGALNGSNSPALMLNGQLSLGAAQLIGGGSLSANGMTVTGATKIVRGWKFENRGVANWLQGDFRVGDGAYLVNSATGGFNAACDATIVNDLGGTAFLENAGMFRKSAGTNQTKIYIPFLNTGSLEVDAGELAFYGNSTNLGAHIEILQGGALTLTGPRHVVDANSTVTGAGGIIFDNGTVDFDAAVDMAGTAVVNLATVNINPASTVTQLGSSLVFARSGTLNLNSGETILWNSLTMSNGVFNGSDHVHVGNDGFQWLGGTISGTGHLDIDAGSTIAGGTKTFRGWTVENHGAMSWSGGNISSGEGSRFVNLGGASVQTDFDGSWTAGSSGGTFFDNFGALQKSAGTNATWFNASFYNEGLVEVDSGIIRFAGSLTNRGALGGLAGTTFAFASANIQLTSLGSLDTEGAAVLESGSVINSGAFRVGSDFTLKSGTFRFTTTTSRPQFNAAVRITGVSTLDLSSGYNIGIGTLIQTNGTLSGSDAIVISNQWFCSNGDVNGSGLLELYGQSFINGGPNWTGRHIINHGEMTWIGGDIGGGTGLMFENAAGATMSLNASGRFTTSFGTGTAFLNRGDLRHDSGSTNQIALPLFNVDGRIYVNQGQLQLTGGLTQTNGQLVLNSGAAVSVTKPLTNYGGTIEGHGDIFGTVFNTGALVPGQANAIGRLGIFGNCTQAVTATLNIELADTNQFDTLAIGGQATLDGKLEISRLNGFVPGEGSSFPVLTCASRVGQFSEVVGGDLPNGRKLVPVYTATGVNLVVSNTLPPLEIAIERLANTNAVKVSWPAGYENVRVQTLTNLCGTNWTEMPVTETNFAIISMTVPTQFFRLHQGL